MQQVQVVDVKLVLLCDRGLCDLPETPNSQCPCGVLTFLDLDSVVFKRF